MAVFLVILVIILLIVERYSLQYALHRVYYRCETSRNLVDPDETFIVSSTIENQKNMMVPFVRMTENFPVDIELNVDESGVYRGNNQLQLTSRFYLMPKQVYTRHVEARIPQRGCHYFRTATLYGGDFLGIKENVEYYNNFEEVVVIPRSVDCPKLDKTLGDYLGEMSVNRFILEDPVLTIGFRDYTGREPMRSVSWTQTARFGKMMVKNYDHTLDLSMTILLNVKTPYRTDESEERVEKCFSLVRAVCEHMEEQQVKYKFVTNASIAGFAGSWSEISEGLGRNHFDTVMEGLGRATSLATEPFSAILDRAFRQSERGRSFIVITPQIDDSWQPELRHLEELSSTPVCVLTPDILAEEKEADIA